ncbi:glycerol-3-phosphate dehydrogenase [Sneathiella sp.]|uniref:glycerol-3-phosphate dehydrogenase n=1 Tax=Sneathiella sp. TaxID=1964365 RepID=UPI003566081D
MAADYDLFIIGGGINGCGIARDAAGRGYSVALCEMGDLASGTSSGSTKLIHGGLRYLEYYEFRLVRKALSEREILWKNAPHIIWPLRFVLPYHKGLRPAWLLRLGLFIYDYIGGRKKLPPTKTLNLETAEVGKPLKSEFSKAFEYSDCWVNDSRLVVLNARDAAAHGAVIKTRAKCLSARREEGLWHITTENQQTKATTTQTARFLVNAAGPWVDEVLGDALDKGHPHNIRLVQGSHIVVPKLFDHDRCYIFQNKDDRIIFAIPYEGDYTLIGTTDQDYDGDPGDVAITAAETSYLCEAASQYFKHAIQEDSIVWAYSAVRPLYDDNASEAQEATRDYVLRQDGETGEAPLLNILGGKITTYRRLAEAAMEMIEDNLGAKKPAWTETAPLPGGDFPVDGFDALLADVRQKYPFLESRQSARLVRAYGTCVFFLLGDATTLEDLGVYFGRGLSEREVRYLMTTEWAMTAEDILWRRSKLGIQLSPENIEALQHWMTAHQQ